MGYLSEQRKRDPKVAAKKHGGKFVTVGGLTAGLRKPERVPYSAVIEQRARPGYDPSLSYQRSKMGRRISDEERIASAQNRLLNRFYGVGEDVIPPAYTGAYAERLRKAGIRSDRPEFRRSNFMSYMSPTGDLITVQSPRKKYAPLKQQQRDLPPRMRRIKLSDYREAPSSLDTTEMTVRTVEGKKKYGKRRAAKRARTTPLFKPGASKIKRSREAGRKEGRT